MRTDVRRFARGGAASSCPADSMSSLWLSALVGAPWLAAIAWGQVACTALRRGAAVARRVGAAASLERLRSRRAAAKIGGART